ncbi:MAG: putative bifunctional diguanylate cyclase/phosphodiesterase [Pseudomonadota bacterium]
MPKRPKIEVLKVVGIYTVLAGLWILFSDRLLGLFVENPQDMIVLQSVKGVGFVLATAGLLYLLILRMEHHLIEAHDALQLDAEVLANMQEGVMVTDADNRLVMVNRSFERITGYQAREILGQNPAILSSGRQPASFYQSLWAQLECEGYWQGEVLNRRKSGEVYPERLSISTILDSKGHLIYYIGIFTDTTPEQQARERIEFLAHYDPLTHLPNRSLLARRIAEAIPAAAASGNSFSLLTLDLDRFKLINDGFGYEAGNALLREIARRLLSVSGKDDVVARQSSDEFSLLLYGRDIRQASHIAGQILDIVSRPFHTGTEEVSFTCSIGIARYPDDGHDPEELLQAAESALTLAKTECRNSYRFHDSDSQTSSLQYMQLEHGLRHAAGNNELLLYYQPQVDCRSGHLTGAEALIRWQHPELGLISPGQFIPVAEESGQIIAIGNWVLQEAVGQLHVWQKAGLKPVTVAINLSVAHFRLSTLVEDVRTALEASQVDPSLLCLEITESVAMADTEYTLDTIRTLQELGICLALDDFGSGYSSFNYLRRLTVQKLKIDRGFIQDLAQGNRDLAIVQSIITLAHSLGFMTIAEGVETPAQLESLRAMGCDQIQGYLFARPMPALEFQQWLSTPAATTKD